MGAASEASMRHGAPGGPLGRSQVVEVVQAALGVLRGRQVSSRSKRWCLLDNRSLSHSPAAVLAGGHEGADACVTDQEVLL